MSPPRKPWFRFYSEAISDPKIRRLKPEQRWLWVAVLALARQSPEPGLLLLTADQPLGAAEVADAAALPLKATTAGLAELVNLGLLERDGDVWSVRKWAERQYESDTSTERVKKFRQRSMKRSIGVTGDVSVTPPDTEEKKKELLTSSTGLQVDHPQPGDNEDRVAVAARRLGQLDHDQAEAAGKVRANPDGHLAACIRNRANDPQLNAIASANPNWTADQLVAAVTGELTRLELAKAAEATQAELDELRAIPADPATNVAGLAEARQARTKPRTA